MSKRMNVLVACEESQAVTIQLRKRGHRAFSCDLMECSGGHPEWHVRWDATALLDGNCSVLTQDGLLHSINGTWDMVIAFPPCTDLAVSGARHFAKKQADGRQQASIEFFMKFANAGCEKISIENPIGIMSTKYRKPDQIIQPYMFGDHARKTTCLWLKGLPPLKSTNVVDPGEIVKGGFSVGASSNYARDENGKILAWNDPRTAKIRSKTFSGIAEAMAEQWAGWATDAINEAKTE